MRKPLTWTFVQVSGFKTLVGLTECELRPLDPQDGGSNVSGRHARCESVADVTPRAVSASARMTYGPQVVPARLVRPLPAPGRGTGAARAPRPKAAARDIRGIDLPIRSTM